MKIRENTNGVRGHHHAVKTTLRAVALALCAAVSLPAHAEDRGSSGPGNGGATANTVVHASRGALEGFRARGIIEFLGIPYAAPPVGDLRWRPPVEDAGWQGIRKATAFGPTCAQITTLGVFAGPPNNNEDCLYLNVFTPDTARQGKEKLPVIVWIPGGGLVDGESNDYDASKLASQGNTVVVTINYRLNLMGFLAHPALDAEGHLFGNYGLLDQQMALRWVQENIGAFGGDSGNVTVGGQSAGASSAAAHVISQLAAGLFQRAIFQSVGASYVTIPTLTSSEAKGVAFAVAAGCGSDTTPEVAQCLRNLPAGTIEQLSGTTSTNGPFISAFILDGTILPSGGVTAFASGQFNHVPIMNGTVEDEGNFNIAISEFFSGPPRVPVTAQDFENSVQATYPAATAQAVLTQYPLSAFATPQLALDAVTTDPLSCRSRRASQLLASQVPVYAYEFQDRTAPFYFPQMPGFQPLAYHTSDIQFLFPLFHGGPDGIPHELKGTQARLSDQLVAAWTNFARTGNPNGFGNSPWPRYEGTLPLMFAENVPILLPVSDAQFSNAHKCDFWEGILTFN